jgi:HME family heavy-metal exporter
MVTIVLTSATTVLGLVPIVFAGAKAGGELLAPLAIVQFGGLLGATILNLIVLPPMAVVFGIGNKGERR